MSINIHQQGMFTILSPLEDIDVNNFKDLDRAFAEQIALKNISLILDFMGVRTIDSSGIGVLVKHMQFLHSSGGEIRLAGVSENLRDLFSSINFFKYFRITKTLNEALLLPGNQNISRK
ncbi:MAG: STAS domain-containing protein [Candidatus Ozemobacteraceae bacterium]